MSNCNYCVYNTHTHKKRIKKTHKQTKRVINTSFSTSVNLKNSIFECTQIFRSFTSNLNTCTMIFKVVLNELHFEANTIQLIVY